MGEGAGALVRHPQSEGPVDIRYRVVSTTRGVAAAIVAARGGFGGALRGNTPKLSRNAPAPSR
jgi:hypothetical protein